MSKGLVGALIGLVVGWFLGIMLQGLLGKLGISGLLLLLTVALGLIGGFKLGGPIGAVIGAVLGVMFGGMVIGLLFQLARWGVMILCAIGGWRLAAGQGR